MNAFFGSVWWLLVSLGILVTFHEFGHYWVARRCGVKVLRFSVGFGRALWSRTARDGTEYVIAALPLGGYVKMLDEREGEVAAADRGQAFNTQSLGKRIAIVAAGPVANLVLAVALLWLMFVIGKPDYQPLIGTTSGIAADAGLRDGDRLLTIDGETMPTWTHAALALTGAALDHRGVQVTVAEADGDTTTRNLPLDQLGDVDERRVLRDIGLSMRQFQLPAVVGAIQPDSAAAGILRDGDRILALGATSVTAFEQLTPALQAQARTGQAITLHIERDGQRRSVQIVPRRVSGDDGPRWLLGIAPQATRAEHDTVLRYGPITAVGAAVTESWRLTRDTMGMLWRIVSGRASLENISGPITIAQAANATAQLGTAWFCYFLALLSLSLAIMNLLPIPVLDGGHLLYYLIELIKGSPVSERALIAGQYVGLALLAGLMGLAFYNDIFRLLS